MLKTRKILGERQRTLHEKWVDLLGFKTLDHYLSTEHVRFLVNIFIILQLR